MLALIGTVIVLAAAGTIAVYVARRRRSSDLPALPDDWWPSFEREFRAYASRVTRSHEGARRRQGGPGPAGR